MTLCLLREHGVDELIKNRKRKNPNLGPNAKQAFFFLLFFWSSMLFLLLFYFYFFVFTFALPVSNRGWKYLKLSRKIFLLGTGAESMTYEPLPLWCTITKAESAKHESIRLATALKGRPRSRTCPWGFQKMKTKQAPSLRVSTNN